MCYVFTMSSCIAPPQTGFRETKRRIVERLENNEDKVLSDAHIRVVQNTRAVNYLKYFLKNTN